MDMPRAPKVSKLEELFTKYEFLVYTYSNRLFNYEQLGYDRDDVVQELRVKLYTSLLAYLKVWKQFRITGRRKPIPAYYYLRTCLISHINDLIRKVKRNQEVFLQVESTSMGTSIGKYSDVGSHDPNTIQIDLGPRQIAVINGVDLFYGLHHRLDRAIWSMFLKGYTESQIGRRFRNKLRVEEVKGSYVGEVISHQRERLVRNLESLTLENSESYQVRELIED